MNDEKSILHVNDILEGDELLSRKIFPLDRRIESGGSNYKHIIIQTIENGNIRNEMFIDPVEFNNACFALRVAEEEIMTLLASVEVVGQVNQ